MMHESNGQRIGKAPFLDLFHTTVSGLKLIGSYLIAIYLQGTYLYN